MVLIPKTKQQILNINMADDQGQKNMGIDDLVRELSKSSTGSGGIPPPAPQATRPSFPTPKPPVQTMPTPPSAPRPQFNTPPQPFTRPSQPKPVPPPVGRPTPSAPLPTSGVKEYQSSIRTMNEDISRLKQGQKPTGIDIPRKVEQAVPIPQPMPPKPIMPSQQFKVPSVNLGDAQKTGPLAQSKDFSRPVPATPAPVPIKPKIEPKPQIYIPEGGQKGGNRNMLFVGIGVVAIVAGFAYWFFILRSPAPTVVIESPTPTPKETLVPTPTPTLTSIFYGVQKQSISIRPTNSLAFFVSDILGKVVVEPGSFKIIEATDAKIGSLSYGFTDLLAKLALKVPSELINNFRNDSAMFVYGQKESFDSKGNLKVGISAPNRIVIIAELKDPVSGSQAVTKWEATLSGDLKVLFALGKASKNQPGFSDSSYRSMNIRYRNFPYPDKTIDYAMVSASNGKTYLIVTDSRESIFATIDKLVNFK